MDNNQSMAMQMSFYFGDTFTLLFPTWKIHSAWQLFGAVAATFFMAVCQEGIKMLRMLLLYWSTKTAVVNFGAIGYSQLQSQTVKRVRRPWHHLVMSHLLQFLLHTMQVGVAYLVMLAVMTYNGWMFLAVVFGTSLGYLAFGWIRYLFRPPEMLNGGV
eukprot:Em0005g521a